MKNKFLKKCNRLKKAQLVNLIEVIIDGIHNDFYKEKITNDELYKLLQERLNND